MENGASWDKPSEGNVNDAAKKYQQIFDLLESLDYVERYVPYNDDLWYNKMIYDDGWPTPAGFIFRDYPSSFAYKAEVQYIPDWWKPSLQDVSMTVSYDNKKNTLNFAVNNPNRDVTDALVVEYSYDGTTWETAYEETARWKFDNTDYTLSVDAAAFNDGTIHFRLHATTLIGGDTYSKVQTITLDTSGITTTTWSGLQLSQSEGHITITAARPQSVTIITPDGKQVWQSVVQGTQHIALPRGIYIIDHKKIHLK
jgi:hypothetical protein